MTEFCSGITQKELKGRLHYNPSTGVFIWVIDTGKVKPGGVAGCVNDSGYIVIGCNNVLYRAHRLAWLYMTGSFPNNYIDHINGNKDDNRWSNLRDVTRSDNAKNVKLGSRNKVGIMGLYWSPDHKRYEPNITSNGSGKIHLGSFKDFFEACCARKSAENKYGFHENHGRRQDGTSPSRLTRLNNEV